MLHLVREGLQAGWAGSDLGRAPWCMAAAPDPVCSARRDLLCPRSAQHPA